MTNVTLDGPHTYNSLNVTWVTADVANMSEMLLVKEGSTLELGAPSAFATKLVLYTTYLEGWTPLDHIVKITYYGNTTVHSFFFPKLIIYNASMEVVYMQAESFSALGLSVTCV
jgi:hypothetical protein